MPSAGIFTFTSRASEAKRTYTADSSISCIYATASVEAMIYTHVWPLAMETSSMLWANALWMVLLLFR